MDCAVQKLLTVHNRTWFLPEDIVASIDDVENIGDGHDRNLLRRRKCLSEGSQAAKTRRK
jgi:hypothetical protein